MQEQYHIIAPDVHILNRRMKGVTLCHYSVLPISLQRFITVSRYSVLHSRRPIQSLAFTIPSLISVGPSCSSMTQKEVCQSAMQTSAKCVFSVCVKESGGVCVIMHCHLEWCHVFFASFLLDSSMCSAAPLCYSSLMFWFLCVFSSYLCLFVCGWYLNRAAELSGVKSVKALFFLIFLFMLLGFFDSLCARFQNWTFSPVTHFSWQSLSLKVYLWAIHHDGQGHKSSGCTPQKCENKCVPCWYFAPFQPNLGNFKVHFCCVYGPYPALPSTAIILIQMSGSYISTPFSCTNPSLSQVIQVIQVIFNC